MNGLSKADKAVLLKNPLFIGMEDEKLAEALRLMKARRMSFEKGEILHRPKEPMRTFGLVLRGSVQACVDDLSGDRIIMADVGPGVTFAEALSFLREDESPVYIYAPEDAEVLQLSPEGLFTGEGTKLQREMEKRFTTLLSRRTLAMNRRIQILSKLTIREKLGVYFTELADDSGSDSFDVPFSRESMAAYIGADRSALSRELSAMKKEGLIDYDRNHFTVLRNLDQL